jgi:molecular chaperone GrpE (heat shock protein)
VNPWRPPPAARFFSEAGKHDKEAEKAAEKEEGKEAPESAESKQASEESAEAKAEVEGSETEAKEAETEVVDPLVAAQTERDKARQSLLLTLADAENTRRQRERELKSKKATAQRKFAEEMASVATVFDRATSGLDANDPVAEGMIMTKTYFEQSLAKHNVTPLPAEFGDKFVQTRMEKVGESADVAEGCIQIIEPGWVFASDVEHVLVRAKVKVGVAVPTPPPKSESNAEA